jgi:methylthioribose-1-phosphate isomerase
MQVDGKNYTTIWIHPQNKKAVQIINQKRLPFSFEILDLHTPEDVFRAIKEMEVRGAPLIGAAGAMGLYLATLELKEREKAPVHLAKTAANLKSSRPTAINLAIAIDAMMAELLKISSLPELQETAYQLALDRVGLELDYCKRIGEQGVSLIEAISHRKKGDTVNILTHCNAGWLACIDYGTATAPIYLAHEKGIKVHVWVDETRPRNQGSKLTAWELSSHGVPNTIIADNTGGHLMQHGMVDLVIVGSDRTTRTGDVANKIGTYLKALAAADNHLPFYVALPSSSFDFTITDGMKQIPIEQRSSKELSHIEGMYNNELATIDTTPKEGTQYANYGFDVTPARLVSGLITERGICEANEQSIAKMFSDLMKT